MEPLVQELLAKQYWIRICHWQRECQRAASEKGHAAYQQLSDPRAADVPRTSPAERQPAPSSASEDEETRQWCPNDATGHASPHVRATLSTFRDLIEGAAASLDSSSDKAASQAETSFQNTKYHGFEHPAPFGAPFNPFGKYDGRAGDSPECDEPTDLSMPKRNRDGAQHADSDDDDIPVRPSKQEEPVRYPTYTDLSDVSNDSVGDATGKKQRPASYPNAGTDYQYPAELNFLNHFIFVNDVVKKLPELKQKINEVLRKHLTEALYNTIVLKFQAIINEVFSDSKQDEHPISEVHECADEEQTAVQQDDNVDEDRETKHNTEHGGSANEESGLSEDDGENAADKQAAGHSSPPGEQQCQQSTRVQSRVHQVQPAEPRAMYSLSEKPPPSGAGCSTPNVQLSPMPAQECVLPTQLNEVDMQSAETSQENVAPPPQYRVYTTEGSTENRPEAMVQDAEPLSGPPAELPLHNNPMAPIFVAEQTSVLPEEPMESSPTMPGTSQSLAVSPSCQSPAQQHAGEEPARVCVKNRREPWYNRSLSSFVADNAFTLPCYVWTERKEGVPRRSMRLAMREKGKVHELRKRQPAS